MEPCHTRRRTLSRAGGPVLRRRPFLDKPPYVGVSETTPEPGPDLVLRFRLSEPPENSFPSFLRQLADGLGRAGLEMQVAVGGGLKEKGAEFGSVIHNDSVAEFRIEIRPVTWTDSPAAVVRIRVDPGPSGPEVAVELRGWKQVLGAARGRLDEWVAADLLPAMFRRLAPEALGEWVMDQQARRPAGAAAIEEYRDPTYHWPNFLLILDRLHLGREDRLLEVGCGGGAFLRKALESGCSATGIDHSPEMVRLTREQNQVALDGGRLTVLEGDAGRLPVEDDTFTKCVCTTAFPFFPDPRAALREMRRALAGGGQLALFMDTAALRGTPAAPEPFASRGRFYEPEELSDLVRAGGFSDVQVEEPNLAPYARAAGLSDEVVKVFDGTGGGMLLLAQKPRRSVSA